MTEDDAFAWVMSNCERQLPVIRRYVDLLIDENRRQNLIAPSTVPKIWSRHIVDSAQLLRLAPTSWSVWVDVGSGAGLPGIIVAILSGKNVSLIEPRRLRADFLKRCCDQLQLGNVDVIAGRVETAAVPHADVISARAVAHTDLLLNKCVRFTSRQTFYLLPKGQTVHTELEVARKSWHGVFHVEQSIVDSTSGIIVANQVVRR